MNTLVTILSAVSAFLAGTGVLLCIWFACMAFATWLFLWVYSLGLQQVFNGPDITFWPMFFSLWGLGILINLIRRP